MKNKQVPRRSPLARCGKASPRGRVAIIRNLGSSSNGGGLPKVHPSGGFRDEQEARTLNLMIEELRQILRLLGPAGNGAVVPTFRQNSRFLWDTLRLYVKIRPVGHLWRLHWWVDFKSASRLGISSTDWFVWMVFYGPFAVGWGRWRQRL